MIRVLGLIFSIVTAAGIGLGVYLLMIFVVLPDEAPMSPYESRVSVVLFLLHVFIGLVLLIVPWFFVLERVLKKKRFALKILTINAFLAIVPLLPVFATRPSHVLSDDSATIVLPLLLCSASFTVLWLYLSRAGNTARPACGTGI